MEFQFQQSAAFVNVEGSGVGGVHVEMTVFVVVVDEDVEVVVNEVVVLVGVVEVELVELVVLEVVVLEVLVVDVVVGVDDVAVDE
jgi:hypothetical protein